MRTISLQIPISEEQIRALHPGDKVLLNGTLFTARDAAHRRMDDYLSRGEELPFDLKTAALFYCGPSPVRPGQVCGAIGPTTSSRMDSWTPKLIDAGLRVMIGKGERSAEVQEAIHNHNGVYFVAVGGAAALLSQRVVSCETLAWPDLGAEAIYKLQVVEFPVYVAIV